ncbi:MAG: hypothetical protein MZV65_47100 [Chromatiales bacterium]|nr:hypothetical protein [Chromatiales bacterium]
MLRDGGRTKDQAIERKWNTVGLYQLDEVLDEVCSKGLPSEGEIGDALLKKIMIYNYVPAKMVHAYRAALLAEFSNDLSRILWH